MPKYNFRLMFLVPDGSIINCEEHTLPLGQGLSRGVLKLLSLSDNAVISKSRWLGIEGRGYDTPEEARAEGLQSKTALMLAGAGRLFGVNCGEDRKVGWVHSSLKEAMGKELRATVLDAVHGLTVYEDVGPVKFVRVEVTGVAMRQPEGMVTAFDSFFGENPQLTEEELTCLELVNASSFEPPRAAFFTLITGCEVLCPQERRPSSFKTLIDKVKAALGSIEGSEAHRLTLAKDLDDIKGKVPVLSACRARITTLLGQEDYKEFKGLYDVRSAMSHEGAKAEEIVGLRDRARALTWRLLLASIRSHSQAAA